MRPTLDDNTRSALHFIVLGLGLTGGLRLAYGLAERWLLADHPDAEVLLPWRAGYLLADAHAVVDDAPALPMRLAAAVGYALLAGVLAAVLAWALRARAWVAVGRAVGAVTLLLALASALFLPVRSATPDPVAGAWRICARNALPGGVALPGTARCTTRPGALLGMHRLADGLQLTLDGRPLATAARSGPAPADSVRARRAVEVLHDHLPARTAP